MQDKAEKLVIPDNNNSRDMQSAQISSLNRIWDNVIDDIWNNAKTY